MAIIYRTTGGWGSGKGSNLTAAEVDGNFYELHGRVAAIESSPPTPNNIADIEVVGSQMTIILDDATELGPFTIPAAAWRFRGDWATATAYAVNDVVSDPADGSLYVVLIGHTSTGSDMDPSLLSGGDPVFSQALDASGFGGGGIAGVTTDATSTINPTLEQANYLFLCTAYTLSYFQNGTNKTEIVLPANSEVAYPIGTRLWFWQGGNGLHVYDSAAASMIYPDWKRPYSLGYGSTVCAIKVAADDWILTGDLAPGSNIITESGTTTTLAYYRQNVYYRCTNASGCDVTVPLNSSSAIDIGAEFHFRQCGAGDVTMVPESSAVVINAKSGSTLSTAAEGSVITLKKVGTDEWDLFGDDA